MNIEHEFLTYMAVGVFSLPFMILMAWVDEWDNKRRRSKKKEGEE